MRRDMTLRDARRLASAGRTAVIRNEVRAALGWVRLPPALDRGADVARLLDRMVEVHGPRALLVDVLDELISCYGADRLVGDPGQVPVARPSESSDPEIGASPMESSDSGAHDHVDPLCLKPSKKKTPIPTEEEAMTTMC
jgi:hypothetical protein